MKLAVIGAGSTCTPELVSGLLRERERISLDQLVLHDIDPARLEVVGGLARRMLERQGYRGSFALTESLERALDGADFVLIQIRVGGQAYYLRYFYAEREVVAEQERGPLRAEVVAGIERELLELYRDPALTEKPALLEQRGGAFYSEAATQLVCSLAGDTGDAQVVDVRNRGTTRSPRTTPVARGLMQRLADEVAVLAGTALRRLSLEGSAADVVLGGAC